MKKFASLVSVLLLATAGLASVEPAHAGPCPLSGDGLTSATAYQINNVVDLSNISNSHCVAFSGRNQYYVLNADIELETNWDPKQLVAADGYTAQFDGGGYTIRGITISKTTDDFVGFFGFTQNAVIKNLTLTGSAISGGEYVGTLIGAAFQSNIANVRVELTSGVDGTQYVGGLIGILSNSNLSDSIFRTTGTVASSGTSIAAAGAGGAVGQSTSSHMNNLGVRTHVRSAGVGAGGIVDRFITYADANLANVSFAGRIESASRPGGVIGSLFDRNVVGSRLSISNSIVRGKLTSLNSAPSTLIGLVQSLGHSTLDVIQGYSTAEYVMKSGENETHIQNVPMSQGVSISSIDNYLFESNNGSSVFDNADISNSVDRVSAIDTLLEVPASWNAISKPDNYATISETWMVDTGSNPKMNQGRPMLTVLAQMGFYAQCGGGSYSWDGIYPCISAPPGSYAGPIGASSVTRCLPGTYQNLSGQDYCEAATPGHFVSDSGAIAEVQCLAGTYQPNFGQPACLTAQPGTFVPVSGATSSTNCPNGYTSNAGASSCFVRASSSGGGGLEVQVPPAQIKVQPTAISIRRVGNAVYLRIFSAKTIVIKNNRKFVKSQIPNLSLNVKIRLQRGLNRLEIFESGRVIKRKNFSG